MIADLIRAIGHGGPCQNAEKFKGTGNFNPKTVFASLQKDGLTGTMAKWSGLFAHFIWKERGRT